MNYETLSNFIRKEMKMTHIYQPIMIKTILKSGDNRATTDEIAGAFLNQDVSQLNYYKKIVKRWPHKTLKKRDVVRYHKDTYRLKLDAELSDVDRDRLIEQCDLRLSEFIDKDPWIQTFRELDRKAISGSLRFDILAKSRGVCVACGARATEAFLHVDHIVPVAAGGRTEPGNLQALCYKCNTQKRDRDETDFMLEHKKLEFRNPKCNLCKKPHRTILDNRLAYAIPVDAAADAGSVVVVPNRHIHSFVDLIPAEKQLCVTLVDEVISRLRLDVPRAEFDVSGFDVTREDHCRISITPK